MDYKIIIILLALCVLIFMAYREISTIKNHMSKNIGIMSVQLLQNNEKIVDKLQNNMTKCLSQIKGISSDNIQQLRKITLLNIQPVTKKIRNHFTETDDSEIRTNLQYFSDVKQSESSKQIFQKNDIKKALSNYYMSEETVKTKDSGVISENAEKSSQTKLKCNGDVCLVNNDKINTEINNDFEVPIYDTNIFKTEEIPIYESINEDKNEDKNEDDKSDVKKEEDLKEYEPENESNIEQEYSFEEEYEGGSDEGISFNNDQIEEKIEEKIEEEIEGEFLVIDDQIKKIKESENIVQNLSESMNDSKKSKKSKKNKILIETVEIDDQIEENTNNKKKETINIETLDKLSFKELVEISKDLSLPTNYKDNNKTRMYKKEDLKKNIKQNLK